MAEPRGVLAETQMPDFSLMGLLLGGRGYASGWYQNRDELRIADNIAAKTRADNAAFSQGVLANPATQAWINNPYDRRNQMANWAQYAGGPADFVQLGNQMLTQGMSATDQRNLAGLQNQYSLQQEAVAQGNRQTNYRTQHDFNLAETLYGSERRLIEEGAAQGNRQTNYRTQHDFNLLEQTHSADEQLRVAEENAKREWKAKQQALDYITQPPDGSLSPEQQQTRVNMAADAAGYGRKEGFDIVQGPNGPIGQVPQRGTPERAKIERVGNAYSNISDFAAQKMWQLQNDPGSIDISKWNADVNQMANDMRIAYDAGAMTADDQKFYLQELLPQLTVKGDYLSPDVMGNKRDKLKALKEQFDRRLHQHVQETIVPIGTYTADDWKEPVIPEPPKEPPSARNQQRLQDLRRQPSVQRPATGGGVTRQDPRYEVDPGLSYDLRKKQLERQFPGRFQ